MCLLKIFYQIHDEENKTLLTYTLYSLNLLYVNYKIGNKLYTYKCVHGLLVVFCKDPDRHYYTQTTCNHCTCPPKSSQVAGSLLGQQLLKQHPSETVA